MNVFIIYCHPSRKSFTCQIFSKLKEGLAYSNHKIIVSDLYEMDFRSDMTETEYEREGFSDIEKPLPNDVLIEQQKIQKSDCIIFIYPLWWSDCPAKLKGWFDRVYSIGYAYGYDADGNKQSSMKKQKLGLAICTAGHPSDYLEKIGITQSMNKIMVADRLGKRFKEKRLIILGGTMDLEKVKDKHLLKAYEIGKEIENYCSQHHV